MLKTKAIFILILSVCVAQADDSVEGLLAQRKVLLDRFSEMSKDQQATEGPQTAKAANILFLRAHEVRLRSEIEENLKRSQLSSLRGWEKDAAQRIAEEKESALASVQQRLRSPPKTAISCLTDLGKDELFGYFSSAAATYSKSSSREFSYEDWRFSLGGAAPKPAETARLIKENSIPSDILKQREPTDTVTGVHSNEPLSSEERSALKELGVLKPQSPSEARDYSHRYSTPKLQPPRTAMCAGFAIASDMESYLNKDIIDGEKISADYTYTALLHDEATRKPGVLGRLEAEIKVRRAGLCNLAGVRADPLAGVSDIANSLRSLMVQPTCSVNDPKEKKSQNQFRITSFQSFKFNKAPSLNFMRTLISSGVTPLATLESEKRREQENWLFPVVGGSYRHVVNVVGYGQEREPNCLNKVDYLIVRDSLGKQPIHYRVPAAEFMAQVQDVHKVTGVRKDILAKIAN